MVRSQSLYLFVNPHGQLISLFLFMTQIKKITHNITRLLVILQFCYLQCSLAFLDKCILCTPWLIYRSTYRPMYWSTYQPSVNWYIGRHIGWHSADISTKICRSTYQLMYQPRYQPSEGRHINWLSADFMVDIAADTLPTRWPLIVGGVSVDCLIIQVKDLSEA